MTESPNIHINREKNLIEVYAAHETAARLHLLIDHTCSNFYRYTRLPQIVSPRMVRFSYEISSDEEFEDLAVQFADFLW